MLGMLLAFQAASCHRTQFSNNFDELQFQSISVGDSVDDVVKKLGFPLKTIKYSTDYIKFPFPDGKYHKTIDDSHLIDEAKDTQKYLVLYYSLQEHPHRDYWRNNIWIQNSVVIKIECELVTE